MINKVEIHKIFDFKNLSLSKDIIRNNGLCGIVIREYPGLIQCEWLENAFSACGNKKVYFFTFEKNVDGFEIKLINCSKRDIFSHMTDSIGQDLCIFSYDVSGIFLSLMTIILYVVRKYLLNAHIPYRLKHLKKYSFVILVNCLFDKESYFLQYGRPMLQILAMACRQVEGSKNLLVDVPGSCF